MDGKTLSITASFLSTFEQKTHSWDHFYQIGIRIKSKVAIIIKILPYSIAKSSNDLIRTFENGKKKVSGYCS
jgi:hypothetical protein